jgi:hypothetical protein
MTPDAFGFSASTIRPVKKASHPMIYKRRTSDTVISTPTPEENAAWR